MRNCSRNTFSKGMHNLEKKGPRIVRLGPEEINQHEDLWSPFEESDKDFEELVFLPREFYMKPNQESELAISENGELRVIVKQEHSTPGFKMDTSIFLEKGEYELEVIGSSSVERTFFPWAMNKSTRERLTPIVHLTSIKDSICVPFSIEEKNRVVIGVLCHNQMIDDECYISSMTIRKLEEVSVNSKGNFNFIRPEKFVPHQKTRLRIEGEHLHVTSDSYSTPGTYAVLDVEPGSKISIRAKAELFPGCSAFLYISPTNGGKELTKRDVVFGRGNSKDHILEERYSFLDIPWDVHSVRVGLLFSTISSAETYKMTIQKFEIVKVKTLEDVIDSTYVLSLENEGEKFNLCQREAKRHGVLLNRWKAVNGYSDEIRGDWENYMQKPWTEYDKMLGRKAIDKPGAWGYLLTMRDIFSDALDRKFESIAVFDDDFVLSKTFTHDFSRLMQQIGDEWDVIYLGASQWAWDGIETDTGKGYYIPSQSTNGSFAVIYKSAIFEDIIYEIRKMDAPFDSGPLSNLTTTKFKGSSFVSFPNIVIANVEKEGIRDSRNQIEYSRRFRWKLEDFPAHFTNWNNSPIVMREEWACGFEPKDTQRVIGVTTFNRRNYLVDFITSFERTASMSSNWCLIVADDGSTDGTIEWLISEYEPSGFGLIVLRNDSLGIARQSNSILSTIERLGDEVEVLYMCNDDIRFERSGWDDLYFDSMKNTGFDHLVYFNPDWKNPLIEEVYEGQFPLVSYCNSEYVMGCFYTITPNLINKIGYFDEIEFPVRGHSHIDYTIRACRIGANKESTTFDVLGSNDYISMETKEDYIRTHKILGIWEDAQISSAESLRRREELLRDKSRLFIERCWG